MMENLRPQKENVIKDIRNLFTIEKETKLIKGRIRCNFSGSSYIEYKSNCDWNKTPAVEDYLIKI